MDESSRGGTGREWFAMTTKINGFTYRDLAECAKREVRQRQRVYPRLVADARMSQAFARLQGNMMEAIGEHLEALAKAEESAADLFNKESS